MRVKTYLSLTASELRLFFRQPLLVLLTIAFPVISLYLLGEFVGLKGEEIFTDEYGRTFRIVDAMVGSTVAWVFAAIGILGIYPMMTRYRERGVFRTLRTRPVPLAAILFSQLAVGMVVTALSLVAMIIVGRIAFGILFGGILWQVLLAFLICYLAFFSLGMMLSVLTPGSQTAQVLSFVIFLPMFLLSGAMGPRIYFPDWLKFISDLLPLSHAFDALSYIWVHPGFNQPNFSFTGVTLFNVTVFENVTVGYSLLYLLVITIVASLITLRKFRWDNLV